MTDKTEIRRRIELLREEMRRERLDAFIVPSTDPHAGEYVPERWEGRKWISGFDGSAGTAVITLDEAALWTDSRYFIAAAEQLEGTGFALMKDGLEETPSISRWLGMKLAHCDRPEVGIDGMVCMHDEAEKLTEELRSEGGITLRTNMDVLDIVWKDRPSVPLASAEVHPMEFAGESVRRKIERLRGELRERHTTGMLIAALDDIAWMLNLRGRDVHCNPVVVSYLLVSEKTLTLFIDRRKVTQEVELHLRSEGVGVKDYSEVAAALRRYDDYSILLDPSQVNHTLWTCVGCKIVSAPSPVPVMKAVKNDTEVEGFRRAMIRDGVALVRFSRWLRPAVEAGGQTELSVSNRLFALRAEGEHFRGLSFDTIAAYGEHGAIVHYEPTPETDVELRPKGFILIDSGAQYDDGTTDITRTIPLGPLTDEQRRVYTLVLKGHIQLEMARFPKGTTGTQLDALARQPLWREGLQFLHGTGHGVGACLCVHEGPQGIRMQWRPTPLEPGMTVTDEPGIYMEGKFGVRIENTLVVEKWRNTDFGEFFRFDSLTLCPIDMEPVIAEMLLPEEKEWLNGYHRRVLDALSPHLDGEDLAWLRKACREVSWRGYL